MRWQMIKRFAFSHRRPDIRPGRHAAELDRAESATDGFAGVQIALVLSSSPDAGGLAFAREAGIPRQ